tara:strand:- start:272 stop:1039 length:768 start_codon:yes stop_codon:yes gene_type:complete
MCQKKYYQKCFSYSYYGSRQNGGYSEYLNVKEWNLIKIPHNVSLDDAALLEPMSVVLHALKILNIKSIKNLTIFGAGFLGILSAKLAKEINSKVIINLVDRNKFKLSIGKEYVDKTILNTNTNNLNKLFEKKTISNVLETTGSSNMFQKTIDIASPGGNILWLGNISSNLELNKKTVSSILRKELTIKGSWNSSFTKSIKDDWSEALQFLKKGFSPSSLVSHNTDLYNLKNLLQKIKNKKKYKNFRYLKGILKND